VTSTHVNIDVLKAENPCYNNDERCYAPLPPGWRIRLGIMLGGLFGGLILLCGGCCCCLARRRRRRIARGLPPPQRLDPASMHQRWPWLGTLDEWVRQKRAERERRQHLELYESNVVAVGRLHGGTELHAMSPKVNRNTGRMGGTDGSHGYWRSGNEEAEGSGVGSNHEERLLGGHRNHDDEVEEAPPRYGSWLTSGGQATR
jgi:hypothetical protein